MDRSLRIVTPPRRDWLWLADAASALETTEDAILLAGFRQELVLGVDVISVMNRMACRPSFELGPGEPLDAESFPGSAELYGVPHVGIWAELLQKPMAVAADFIQYQENEEPPEVIRFSVPVEVRRSDVAMALSEVARLRGGAYEHRWLAKTVSPQMPKVKAQVQQDAMLRAAIEAVFPEGLPPAPPNGSKDPAREKVFERSEFAGWSESTRKAVWARRNR